MDQYIGKLLDNRYELLEVIGVGGMAVVYKAYCHRLHRFVALKMLKKDLAADEEFRRRFHDEAKAVAMLSHPNIVSVYDVSSSDDQDYIVMELIDGITLKQYMRTKDDILSWRESLHFITQIVRALGHAHGRGIIHRDIKPQNIMVLRDGSVKVADFGIARVISAAQNTLTQEALGSVHYISPEQAKGGHIDTRADLYSAGVVLYEMLTGRLPFEGDSPVSVAIQHISATPLSPRELNPEIPESLEAITLHAMAPKLERRYASAEEMLHDLEEFRKNPNIDLEYDTRDYPLDPDEPTQILDSTGSLGLRRKELERSGRLSGTDPGMRAARAEAGMRESSQQKRVRFNPIIAVVSLFVIGVACFLWIFFFSGFFKEAPEYTVPNMIGKTLSEIHADPEIADIFTIKEVGTAKSEKYPEGTIIKQDPDMGAMLKGEKPTISVTVSSGKDHVMMIDVANYAYRDALVALENMGLKVATPEYESDDKVTKGNVISFTPLEGTQMTPGDTVNLVVSKGPEVKYVTVLSFENKTIEEARKMITDSNLKSVTTEIESDKPKGTVIYQNITAGTEVEAGTSITLQVSKGPPAPPPADTVKTKNLDITLPTDMETVSVLVTVDGVEKYKNDVLTATSATIHPPVDGSGVQEIRVYFNGEMVQRYDLDFNQ